MNVFDLKKAMEAPVEELEESSNTVFMCPIAKTVKFTADSHVQ